MKRSAATSLIAAIGLIALSAAPASAAPVNRIDTPEECIEFLDDTFCFDERLLFSSQATPSGVVTLVGKTTFHSTRYDGPGKEHLLSDESGTVHFSNVSRNGDTVVSFERMAFTATNEDFSCTITNTFIQTGSEVRHANTTVKCT
jgi:hypothetical protein